MRRYWLVMGAVLLVFLLLFGVAEALHLPLLTDPTPYLGAGGVGAALLGLALLLADVLLPVPSSAVMIAHGALFGVVGGTLLSLLGAVGATMVAFAIGRRGSGVLARVVSPQEQARADALLHRWGALAILVTRPIPLLAETVALMAGASPLGWRRALLAAGVGALPASLLYAITGATAASLDGGMLAFGIVLAVAALFWWLGNRSLLPLTPVGEEG